MIGWLVVLAVGVGIAAVARWYMKGGGVSGYRGQDAQRVKLVRIEQLSVDYSH